MGKAFEKGRVNFELRRLGKFKLRQMLLCLREEAMQGMFSIAGMIRNGFLQDSASNIGVRIDTTPTEALISVVQIRLADPHALFGKLSIH